ncbi:hypothetical protein B484DRAFT_455507 [Ochromonadaceae sp. CCMP2298]|nr:hypothetical protein B484DRAFT_455507 [Ochromonadaceae sp. CCMP2298]
MHRLAEFTRFCPAYRVFAGAGGEMQEAGTGVTAAPAAPAAPSLTHKRLCLQQITADITFARDSEGQVLYFLDQQGGVLELLKVKTWWYVWRRSVREMAARLFEGGAGEI